MHYRPMGALPYKVSALGFGCMRLPRNRFMPTIHEKLSSDIIRYGIDRGINYIDTAWLYPQSEKTIGATLKGGYREKVMIATKLPVIILRKKNDFERYLDQALSRLNVDCIDFYLFHMLNQSNFNKVKKFDLLDNMERAQKAGKIKHIGFSIHDTLPVFKKIIDYYHWDMTLVQHNYMDTAIQVTTEGLKYAYKKKIAVVVMEPLKGGQLATPPHEALNRMKRASVKRTPVDWALQFLWNQPEISCVLSGMSSRKMVEENCTSADTGGIGTLSDDEMSTIGDIAAIYRKKIIVSCTACRYCMPCPAGVNIPQNFALINNKSIGSQGKFQGRVIQWLITRGYGKLAKNKKQLNTAHDNGRASLCIKCNACIPKCPQKLTIPQELEKVTAVFETGTPIDTFHRG